MVNTLLRSIFGYEPPTSLTSGLLFLPWCEVAKPEKWNFYGLLAWVGVVCGVWSHSEIGVASDVKPI